MRIRNDANAFVSALEAAGWKMMETAPKDGRFFAAFPSAYWQMGSDVFPYVICRWAEAEEFEGETIEAGWHDSEGHAYTKPTHWFPLPNVFPSIGAPETAPRPATGSGVVIYADGACEPNPGAGGWGFVVYRDGVEVHSECGGALQSTNNIMELTAALKALRWFAEQGVIEPIRLLSDSKYTVDGCNVWRHSWKKKGWRRKSSAAKAENAAIANLDLWKELDEALTAVPISLEWCKGHAGIIGNERADELSLIGRDKLIEAASAADPIRRQLEYVV